MKYKINLHAHTFFSDGYNSPLMMAMSSLKLGFSALVVTDHFRNGQPYSNYNFSLLKDACNEARDLIPVIIGMEILVEKHEMLLFGGEAIKQVLRINQRPLKYEDLEKMKKRSFCAAILCHPGNYTDRHAGIVDGYEKINSGRDWFKNDRPLGKLAGLTSWCNSDAHAHNNLQNCWNIVDTKIENESELIRYIKRGKQPEFFIKEATM
jgi:predicted metal-dependent phosphoesterase TrpH